MSSSEMPKAYNPKDFEDRVYKYWTDNDCFQSVRQRQGSLCNRNTSANVTGVLIWDTVSIIFFRTF